MADGSGVKQFTDEMEQATSEVAQDVKDQVGQAIEQGVQSVAGKQLTPQQINNPTASEQQKKLEDQKKLANARKVLAFYQKTEEELKKVREEEKQKKLQIQQIEEQEKLRKKQEEEAKKKVIISPAKKTPQFPGQAPIREDIARTRQEISKGHGVGG